MTTHSLNSSRSLDNNAGLRTNIARALFVINGFILGQLTSSWKEVNPIQTKTKTTGAAQTAFRRPFDMPLEGEN
jgi:hypothetical protein